MSRFLKIIVNLLLLVGILSAGALVIPPFAGVTTVSSDGTGSTNLTKGTVTYARTTKGTDLAIGDRVLINENGGEYLYKVTAADGDSLTVANEVSGESKNMKSTSNVDKVIVTIPFIGFLSIAAQSKEGMMILGLCVVFLVILFILSEVWKSDDDDEDDEEDEDEEDEDEEDEDEEDDADVKRKRRTVSRREEPVDDLFTAEAGDSVRSAAVEEPEEVPVLEPEENSDDEEEVDLAAAMEILLKDEEEEPKETVVALDDEVQEIFVQAEDETVKVSGDEPAAEESGQEAESIPDEIESMELAIPIYTAEELLEKAHAAGDDPKVIEDPATGITILDYSDII